MPDEEKKITGLEGVSIRRNKKNKFVIFQLHYRANPDKRSKEYVEELRSKMPIAQFKQEFELEWMSFSGMPVYQDFQTIRHLAILKPEPWIGLPMLRGWDFGLTPACVVAQLQGQQLVVFREFTEFNMGAEQFCEKIMPQMAQLYPGMNFFDFADPAGVARAQSNETTCFEILGKFGITPIPGPVVWEKRKQAVEHFLVRKTKDGEALAIWEADCPLLVRGFKGGYRYPEKAKDVEPEKLRPIKDMHSHVADAFQYLAAGVRQGGLRQGSAQIPTQSYFQGSAR